jgi:ubiquinone/menaquinone biosynthesis C-methylase UbiE
MNAKEKTKNHFNQTAAEYDNSSDGKFVSEMYDVLVEEIGKSPNGKILDVGCGNGNLFSLLPDGKYELYGIDFSQNMIDEAKMNCGTKAKFAVSDAEELPFDDDSFDIIVCNASFHHYVHPNTVLKEMHRVLKYGGKLLIGDPYVPGFARPLINILIKFSEKGDYHFYGLNEMQEMFLNNEFIPLSSVKTGEHTALHIAEK